MKPRRRPNVVPLALGAVLALLAPGEPAFAAGPRVLIDAPRPGEPLIGSVVVAFRVEGADPSAIAGATVLLDGRQAATAAGPPWRVTIDAGDELRARRVDVVVRLQDGRELKATLDAPRPPATELTVRLVTLAVSVTDRGGRAVKELRREDFDVREGGRAVEIESFEAERVPLAVALVLDSSNSMEGEPLDDARRAAQAFVKDLDPRDQVQLFAFGDEVREVTAPTRDREAVSRAIGAVSCAGGTALYDAVHKAAQALGQAPGEMRRVLVLLSDGRDEASSGLEPGSFHTLEEAQRQVHAADAVLFAVGLGNRLDDETDFTGRMSTAQVLERLAQPTGGTTAKVGRSGRLGSAFKDVLETLRDQYWLAYRPAPARPGESWRPVDVRVSRPGLNVRARQGYFVD
jgi:VWFA-related protein